MDKDGTRKVTEEILRGISKDKGISWAWLAVFLAIYAIATVFVNMTTISEDVLVFGPGRVLPIRSLAGPISSVANLCLLLIAVFYGKPGFIISLVILLAQFPLLTFRIVVQNNLTVVSGIFSNALIVAAVVLLYMNNRRIKRYQERLRDQAITDRLTGLPNRFACSELIKELERRDEKFVTAVVELSNFQNIGNAMGRSTVDALLIEVANRWKALADSSSTGTLDFITRHDGNEFVFVIRDYDSEDAVIRTLERYEDEIKEKITVDEVDYFPTAAIGYAEYPTDAKDNDALFVCAHTALAEAAREGSDGKICRFTLDLLNAEHILAVERKIRSAIEAGRLFFHLQPQFDIEHKLSGFEALARIRDEDGSIMSPAVFIPVAEKVGLIDQIDYLVFRDAAKFIGGLIEKTGTDVKLSVNVSVKHLMKNDFLDEVRGILDTCGVPAAQLEIEITESVMIDSVEKALECIAEMRKMGLKIAIDDFGTVYSSLSYLNNFPANLLKVDKAFIDQMNESDASKQYVAAIISMGHVMNFDVIAEGVETEDQLETLREIGCDYIQGFLWGRPLPAEEAEALVVASAR